MIVTTGTGSVPLITSKDTTQSPACSHRVDLAPGIESKFLKDGYLNDAVINPKASEIGDESTYCQENDRTKNYKPMLRLSLLRQKRLLLYLVSGSFRGFAYFIPFTFLPDMVVSNGWSRAQAAWLITAIGIVNTVCRIPLGKMADMACINRTLITTIALISIGIISTLMPLILVYEILLFVCVVFGIVIGKLVN